jgi:predicted MFS family arabinose efflux permease
LVNTISALAAGLIASQMGYKGLPVFATVIMIGAVATTIHIARKQRVMVTASSEVEAQS